jgi:hypothetical protein
MSARINLTRAALAAGVLSLGAIGAVAFQAFKPVTYHASSPARQIHLAELIGGKFPVARSIEVLSEPEIGAPAITRVRQGSDVMVQGVVDGEGWYQIALPDQQLGYVQVSAIPAAAAPAQASAATPSPATMPTGPAQLAADQVTPPPVPDTGAAPTIQVPPVVEFEDAHEVAQVVNPSAVYLKPDRLAPTAYPVDPGTQVYIIARSKDGNWAWVDTADNAPAYMPMSDIGR